LVSQVDMLTDMCRERDKTMFEMQWMIDDMDVERCRLLSALRDVVGEVRDLRHRPPVQVIDLTGNDKDMVVAVENEEPLMVRTVVRVERDDIIVPATPQQGLVEIRDDGQSTPQIVTEVERQFERMERHGSVEQRAYDEEANYVAWEGAALEYLDAPPYEFLDFYQ